MSKYKPITVSINPTYLCNFRCNFCYLTEEQLGDKKTTALITLGDRLQQIVDYCEIDYVDLYGGEITTLSEDYIDGLLATIKQYYGGPINVVTNLSKPIEKTPWLLSDDIILSVSWDYTCRERWADVMMNMAKTPKDIHVLLLASRCMVEWTFEELGACQWILNGLKNIKSVEIKPYSTNQANQDYVSFSDYEKFIMRWIEAEQFLPEGKNYQFVNTVQIRNALNQVNNAWSDDHIYITPRGKFAVLEFDKNDNEYFLHMDYFHEYILWAQNEKRKVLNNQYCKECPHLGHCLSEHLRDVKDLNTSCNGFRNLLDWYEHRIQTQTKNVQPSGTTG